MDQQDEYAPLKDRMVRVTNSQYADFCAQRIDPINEVQHQVRSMRWGELEEMAVGLGIPAKTIHDWAQIVRQEHDHGDASISGD